MTETERWYSDQAISPPPGELDPRTEDDTVRGVDLGDQGEHDVVEFQRNLAELPAVLTPADAALYREIFALQEKGNWKEADKRIAKLSDRMLLGHVYYQRYMHPTAYRSSYKELSKWMEEYRDHPGAERVYDLALRRRPKGGRRPPPPERERGGLRSPSKDAYA
ncbi:MAG: hypothetical protein ACREH3_14245, partial [Geminicoccales bacterium]